MHLFILGIPLLRFFVIDATVLVQYYAIIAASHLMTLLLMYVSLYLSAVALLVRPLLFATHYYQSSESVTSYGVK